MGETAFSKKNDLGVRVESAEIQENEKQGHGAHALAQGKDQKH